MSRMLQVIDLIYFCILVRNSFQDKRQDVPCWLRKLLVGVVSKLLLKLRDIILVVIFFSFMSSTDIRYRCFAPFA